MIDIVNIKGKKVIFIDELTNSHISNVLFQMHPNDNDDYIPISSLNFSFRKREKLGERIAY